MKTLETLRKVKRAGWDYFGSPGMTLPPNMHSISPRLRAAPLTLPKLPFPSTMRKLKSESFTLSRLLDNCLRSSDELAALLPAGPSLAF